MKNLLKTIFIAFLFLLTSIKALATSWDEPWMDEVIKKSDYFILAEIISYDEQKGANIRIIKQFGGEHLPEEINISEFYNLNLGSLSEHHGPEFHFDNLKEVYFFLKKIDDGNYSISTPTSGYDYIKDGNVFANYRHSYHQAMVPIDVYEMSMTAIYNHYHALPFDRPAMNDFINTQLSLSPKGFDDSEIGTFFLQHVALECIYHLKLDGFYSKILPFFKDDHNFHNRISAARALTAYHSNETIELLVEKIKNNNDDDFVTVICIWTLGEFKPKELKHTLDKLIKNASSEENGFGGNIMDPRVGTYFPSVKTALEELVKIL